MNQLLLGAGTSVVNRFKTASSAADLVALLASSSAGTVIYVPNGTYAFGASTLVVPAGVTLVGQSQSGVTLQCGVLCDTAYSRYVVTIRNLTIDATGIASVGSYGACEFHDGRYLLEDVTIHGANTADNLVTFVAQHTACTAYMVRCTVHTAKGDCISTKAPGGQALGEASKLYLSECEAYTPGSGTSDNCLTAHEYFGIDDYNGYYHDGLDGPTIAQDGANTPINLYGTRVVHSGTETVIASIQNAEHASFTGNASLSTYLYFYGNLHGCLINGGAAGCRVYPQAGGVRVENCTLLDAVIYCNATRTGTIYVLRNNIIALTGDAPNGWGGIWNDSSSGSTWKLHGNVLQGWNRGIYVRYEASPTLSIVGNTVMGGTFATYVYTGGAGSATITGCGNRFNGLLTGWTVLPGDSNQGTNTTSTPAFAGVAVNNTSEGGTAKLTRKSVQETVTLTGATKTTETINVPSGARLLAVQMCVNTAVVDTTGDDTWTAAFSGGSTTAIVSVPPGAAAKQTKVNLQIPDEITTNVTNITFTPNGGEFSAGVIEVVVYYEELTAMANGA